MLVMLINHGNPSYGLTPLFHHTFIFDVEQLMSIGRQMLGKRHVLPGVSYTLHEVQVEGTFPDGTKLVTVHDPIATQDGDLSKALFGSFLPIPDNSLFPLTMEDEDSEPGKSQVVKYYFVINVYEPYHSFVCF
jgi:urease